MRLLFNVVVECGVVEGGVLKWKEGGGDFNVWIGDSPTKVLLTPAPEQDI